MQNGWDGFVPIIHESYVGEWKTGNPDLVYDFASRLKKAPNQYVHVLDDWIENASIAMPKDERRYRALQVSSQVLQDIKLHTLDYYGEGENDWKDIHFHWIKNRNLLKSASGLLLPVREIEYVWASSRQPKPNTSERHFPSFIRWTEDSGLTIQSTILPDTSTPIQSLRRQLKIAIVPLVSSVEDFIWEEINSNNTMKFRVSLKNPEGIISDAKKSIQIAGKKRATLLYFQSYALHLTSEKELGPIIKEVAYKSDGFPWLVVAGSAHTSLKGVNKNRALIFDRDGNEIFHYNKLHPYEISVNEMERYGLPMALNGVPRAEDIDCGIPRFLPIVDTSIGRLAIIICEDLSKTDFVSKLVANLRLDWLIVPVLDGIQRKGKWTARYSQTHASDGTSVLVATSQSLVSAELSSKGDLSKNLGVGLFVKSFNARNIKVLKAKASHNDPVIFTVS